MHQDPPWSLKAPSSEVPSARLQGLRDTPPETDVINRRVTPALVQAHRRRPDSISPTLLGYVTVCDCGLSSGDMYMRYSVLPSMIRPGPPDVGWAMFALHCMYECPSRRRIRTTTNCNRHCFRKNRLGSPFCARQLGLQISIHVHAQ